MGHRSRHVEGVTRIAVLRANALGDHLFATPALASLRAAYPEAEIVLLGLGWHRDVLAGRPGPLDDVAVVPPSPGLVPGLGAPDAVERFLAGLDTPDLALQLHGGGRTSNPFVARLGAGVTAGCTTPDATRLDRNLAYDFYQPEVFRLLEVVGLVGAEPVTYRPTFAVTDADRAEAAPVLAGLDAAPAVLHPGASDTRRRWPPERFAAVADHLVDAGVPVLVTGTPDERDLVTAVLAAMHRPARPVVGDVGIGGLAALLAAARLVVSNDTGPLHLAGAVGTPTVGLYWVGNMINAAPPDRARHRPLISWTTRCPRCGADCTRDLYPDRDGGPPCEHRDSFLADVPVGEVVEATTSLLAAC